MSRFDATNAHIDFCRLRRLIVSALIITSGSVTPRTCGSNSTIPTPTTRTITILGGKLRLKHVMMITIIIGQLVEGPTVGREAAAHNNN